MIEYLDLHMAKFEGEAVCVRWYGTMESNSEAGEKKGRDGK